MAFGTARSLGGLFNCGCQAAAAKLVVTGTTYLADFTGNLAVLLDPNELARFLSGVVTGGATMVSLLIQEHVSHGIGTGIGLIEVVMDPDRVPPPSTLTAIVPGTPFPAIQDMHINIHVRIPNLLPGITLRNKLSNPGPAILRNPNLIAFPPQNDVYQLVEPIDLEDVNNPGPVLATIQTFPVTVNPPTP
ncbi:MAG: hypothetical protein JO358_03425 [Alphaproteobacteria bacterium]|nr:hypothetical protein [Alphaproteobacteria bacterium]